jgi:hypothetical protein
MPFKGFESLAESTSFKVLFCATAATAPGRSEKPVQSAIAPSGAQDVALIRRVISAIGPRWQWLHPVSDRTRIECDGAWA